jgi:hypothetical protein
MHSFELTLLVTSVTAEAQPALMKASVFVQAVTRNELYGYLHPATREWKEGLMSVTFRNFANDATPKHQWIVLDGDIDAEWIESMNTARAWLCYGYLCPQVAP